MRPTRTLEVVAALALATATPLAAAQLHMFVTSAMGPGNLAAWPDADGVGGLAGADAVCQKLASEAGLANATAYRAYLSDGSNDAYCRIHGMKGKMADNCDQEKLPVDAGPWWRLDGKPFGADLPDLYWPHNQVLLPPARDQKGRMPPPPFDVWTGTQTNGAASTSHCTGWTSLSDTVHGLSGILTRTAYIWGSGYSKTCDLQQRLYCFELGDAEPLPSFPAQRPLAFVTSQYGYGDLGAWPQAGGATGIAAGDAVCQVLADYAELPDAATFKAWLSDAATDAADRFVNRGPWARLDGMVVAGRLEDLTGGTLSAPISVTENGDYTSSEAAWTGTLPDGTAAADTCDNWSSELATFEGMYGLANATLDEWGGYYAHACDHLVKRLYCLQDLPLLFYDDFESAGFRAWSDKLPPF